MNATVKKLFAAVLITTTCLFAAGCGSSSNSGASGDKKEIKMGVTAGPHAEVMEEVAKEAAKQGLDIKVVEFNDYVQPNKALADGDLLTITAREDEVQRMIGDLGRLKRAGPPDG